MSMWDQNNQTRSLKRAQGTLREILPDLRAISERLASLEETVPDSEDPVVSELREGLACVQDELLDDAIQTLETVANSNAAELREAFLNRRALLVRMSDKGT